MLDRFSRYTPKAVVLLAAGLFSLTASALEYPIGTPQQRNGMEIAAVYLQAVNMEPEGMMRKAEESDIHIEADIHALANNANGFEEGAWIPYLVIKYEITKVGSNEKITGDFMPMVANDGPHYGDNIKLLGAGKYHVKYMIEPPSANTHAHFGRHTDRLTGVRPWFKPFTVEYDFTYAGIGKKGGY
ncbi:MAG: iron transporter [Pseudomonadota bacterium]